MQSTKIRCLLTGAFAVTLFVASPAEAQNGITTPMQQFGHEIGADHVLPNYSELVEYWEKLAAESDRMVLDTIGMSAEGRPQLMAIITSPENHQNLERYKDMNRQLAMGAGLTDEQARQLARDGKAVVWFDGGLHATEVLGAQQLMETVYQLLSANDEETLRFLDDLIILAVHANPDGMELVSNWYMRNSTPEDRSSGGIPRLYQKYVGHDNNRDFYASTQNESENMNSAMYREWYPVIMYNHHQSGPAGTVMFSPPFRDPPNHYFDPLILTGLELVGGSMHDRFVAENKPGVTTRSGASYSTWWNGGLRTMAYFHNIVGLLTETIGNPTPSQIPFLPDRVVAESDLPLPIEPQTWHFRQSIDYSVTANKAVFDIASRRKEHFLFNMYLMATRAIAKGNTDTWTITPNEVAEAEAALEAQRAESDDQGGGNGGRGGRGTAADFERLLRDPADRDPRGYILSADQPDFLTAAKFMEALAETGVQIHRATSQFQVAGKTYPAGSFVVKSAQPFRAHVIDMFEPQHHPNDLAYPGGPPVPPYDVAGWTLAYQMGVEFDRIMEAFDGPFEEIPGPDIDSPPGSVSGSGNAGFLLGHATNDAFVAVNRLLADGKDVVWLREAMQANGRSWPAGTFFIPAGGGVRPILEALATEKGLNFVATGTRPAQNTSMALDEVRIGLVDRYGGSMPSGWTRWLFEQFEFPFQVVFPKELDAGNLNTKYDVLVFVDGMIPEAGGGGGGGRGGGGGPSNIPPEFQNMTGNITAAQTIPQIRSFLEGGGTVIAIGSSTALAQHLELPVHDHLVEIVDGEVEELPEEKYYVPGSVLEAQVDNTNPLAHGMGTTVDVFFDNSPVFRLDPGAALQGVHAVSWFGQGSVLRSGWTWGERYLNGGATVVEADVGRGKLFLFGPEIVFRAQPHGTFKFLFNGIYYGASSTR
ncbi:MAG: M14 family metallopeptidase [Longimicrobiales bacterium]